MVETRAQALERGTRTTWIETNEASPATIWVYERVPFGQEVDSTDRLEEELSTIMETAPDFECLSEATKQVATTRTT